MLSCRKNGRFSLPHFNTSGSINAGAGNGARDSVLSSGVNIRSGGESGRARPVLLRAFTKSSKIFTLRDVPIYTTCEDLKEEIRAQLEGDVKHEFDGRINSDQYSNFT